MPRKRWRELRRGRFEPKLLVNDGQRPSLSDTIQLLEAQVKMPRRVASLEEERFQMFQRLRVLERSLQQQPSAVSAPTSATVAAASPPAAIQPTVANQTTPAAAKPTTSPPPSAVRAPLHRKTLSVLKVGGRST
jgi:cell division septation protein DedD